MDVVELPKGANVLDFAYYVHTSLGHRCIGAKVNNKIVSLNYTLSNSDVVDILTAKNENPSKNWLNDKSHVHVTTKRAKQKIRSYFIKKESKDNIANGHNALIKELRRKSMSDVNLHTMLPMPPFKSMDMMYEAIARGSVTYFLYSLYCTFTACFPW